MPLSAEDKAQINWREPTQPPNTLTRFQIKDMGACEDPGTPRTWAEKGYIKEAGYVEPGNKFSGIVYDADSVFAYMESKTGNKGEWARVSRPHYTACTLSSITRRENRVWVREDGDLISYRYTSEFDDALWDLYEKGRRFPKGLSIALETRNFFQSVSFVVYATGLYVRSECVLLWDFPQYLPEGEQ